MKQKTNTTSVNWRRIIKRPVTLILARCERALLDKAPPLRYPPVFVLGVPRSGTTLLYQLLVYCYDVSYFCNAAEDHSSYLAVVTRLLRSRIRHHVPDFRSDYGRTTGRCGPNEGFDIWRRWFPDGYVDERCLSTEAADDIRRIVGAVSDAIGRPFINKDPDHCVRVRALDVLFPECLFVYIQRDPLATAESMLSIRRKRAAQGKSELNEWIATKPKEYARIREGGYITQVAGQVYYCEKNALEDLQSAAPDRHLLVSYETLWARPEPEVKRIAQFLQSHGVPLRQRRSPPQAFEPPERLPVPGSDHGALRAELAQLCADSSVSASHPQCT